MDIVSLSQGNFYFFTSLEEKDISVETELLEKVQFINIIIIFHLFSNNFPFFKFYSYIHPYIHSFNIHIYIHIHQYT